MESQINNEIFIIIKPGFLNLSGKIIKKFEDSGYEIKQSKTKKLLLSEAKELYSSMQKIFSDPNNSYFEGTTDQIREIIQLLGQYDGIIFKIFINSPK